MSRAAERGKRRPLGLLLLAVVGVPTLLMLVPPGWFGMDSLAPDQVQERLVERPEDIVVVDVRTGMEFQHGHIAGALGMPLHTVPFHLKELGAYQGREVVLVCLSGHRSRLAGLMLRLAGFSRLANLDGGMAAWERSGLRSVSGAR